MMRRFLLFLAISAGLYAQREMTVAQLTGFVQSSAAQHSDDRAVAEVVKKIKLTEKLDQRTASALMSLGGPKTANALHDLSEGSRDLPDPPPPAAAPPKLPPRILTTPDSEERVKILDAVREYALNYTANLPNFICTQVTR